VENRHITRSRQIGPDSSALRTFSGSRRCSEDVTVHEAVSGRSTLPHVSGEDDAGSLTGFPSGRTLNPVAESIVFRAERNQAAFAVLFLAFGCAATMAFLFALDVFNAAHRLFSACRIVYADGRTLKLTETPIRQEEDADAECASATRAA